jgi:hypothetical protein
MKRKLVFAASLAALIATLAIGSSRAQNPSDNAIDNANDNAAFLQCGTKEPTEKEKKLIENNSRKLRELKVAADSSAALERTAGSVTINVYFHVITNKKNAGNISDAAIQKTRRPPRPAAVPSAATPARSTVPTASTPSRTSWTTARTRACTCSRRGSPCAWTTSTRSTGSKRRGDKPPSASD